MHHKFLLVVLKKFGLGNNFIDWVKTLQPIKGPASSTA